MGSRDGLLRLLRHFGATTLSFSSARRRNSFHSSLRLNGTSDIGIASWKLVASDQQVWYLRLSASRRQDNRLRAYLYELEAINRTCLRRPQQQAMQPLASRSQPNHSHLPQRTMTSPTPKSDAARRMRKQDEGLNKYSIPSRLAFHQGSWGTVLYDTAACRRLNGVATHTHHAEQTRLTFTSLHSKRSAIQAVLTNLAGFLRTLKATAEQWIDADRLRAMLTRAFATVLLSTAGPRTCSSQKLRRHDTLTAVFRMKDELSKWPNNWGEVRSVYKGLKIVAYRAECGSEVVQRLSMAVRSGND